MPLDIKDLGRMDYHAAWEVQKQTHAAVLAGDAPDTLLLVEHDPVITLGRRTKAEHLLASRDLLAEQGVSVVETDRGGDITYHGPGQLVAYPIIHLNRHGLNLRGYVRMLERAIIDTLADFDVPGHRDGCAVGVWVGGDGVSTDEASGLPISTGGGAKIAAIGVRVVRWITMHGLALNVNPNLAHFNLIVPCGLAGRPVTSLAQQSPTPPTLEMVSQRLADHLSTALQPKPDLHPEG